MKTLVFIAGARPNFMKIVPIIRAAEETKEFKSIIVHTGQHYDDNMSKVFFKDLDIPEPHFFFGVGGGSHAEQTAKIMVHLEKVLKQIAPNLVIVVGDVNSTAAGAITAKKLGIKVAHVEAGLRSFDMSMPEEINRIVTDSISDFFFTTEKSAIENLRKEGKDSNSIFFVGNVMIDSMFYALDKLRNSRFNFPSAQLKEKLEKYIYLTLHRPSNVDSKEKLSKLIEVLESVSKIFPIVFPVHPRTKNSLTRFNLRLPSSICTLDPLSYIESLFLWKDAFAVVTDSGGLQEETTVLQKPCFTIRNNTERPVTVELGTNVLVREEEIDSLPDMIADVAKGNIKKGIIPPKWNGKASFRIVKILKSFWD